MKSLNASKQLVIDMYGCDKTILNSREHIEQAAHQAIQAIGAAIVDECIHTFSPIGITYFAVITSSHFSISSICSSGRKVSMRMHFITSASSTLRQYW